MVSKQLFAWVKSRACLAKDYRISAEVYVVYTNEHVMLFPADDHTAVVIHLSCNALLLSLLFRCVPLVSKNCQVPFPLEFTTVAGLWFAQQNSDEAKTNSCKPRKQF